MCCLAAADDVKEERLARAVMGGKDEVVVRRCLALHLRGRIEVLDDVSTRCYL
jgi:hypothetical protein